MKKLLILLLINGIGLRVFSQDTMSKVMEKRAREFYRVIGLSDKQQWKKFISENYTQALIDKPMTARVISPDGNETKTSGADPNAKQADKIEAKAKMYERLHNDFGNSTLSSLKPADDKIEMALKSSGGLQGTFTLKFDKNKPYLIDGLGVEAGGNH